MMNRTSAAINNGTPEGLFSQDQTPIPLEGVKIECQLIGLAVEMVVIQRYLNIEDKPIEATYLFPLPEEASVCGFNIRIGDRTIRGEIEEREKAFEIYDDAIAQGHGAFLFDQERPNIFQVSVGNVLPGQIVDVEIRMIYEARYNKNSVRMMIPTTVSPRYVPDHATVEQLREFERISPPYQLEVPYGLTIQVDAKMHSPIRAIESPSHTVRTEMNGSRASVTLSQGKTAMDRDFILLLESADERQAGAFVSERNGMDHIMMELYPKLQEDKEPKGRDVIFLIDCSGSMMGDSIEQARRALDLCVRTLREGDLFQIVRFGSKYEFLSEELLIFSQKTLDETANTVSSMEADLGGTEILEPFQEILRRRGKKHFDLILLTDGEVFNEDEILSLARKNRNHCRIFSFGIGAGSSEFLVRGLAREGRGQAEFIFPGERIEEKVLRQFTRIDSPAVEEIRIDWGDVKVDSAPGDIPPIFSGDSFILTGRIEKGQSFSGGEVIKIKVKVPSSEETWSVNVDRVEDNEKIIPLIWARKKIRDLEESYGTPRASQQARKRNTDKNLLLEVSRDYQVLSSLTSFIALEERLPVDQTDEPAVYRQVPVAITKGWHGLNSLLAGGLSTVSGGYDPDAVYEPKMYIKEAFHSVSSKFSSRDSALGKLPVEDTQLPVTYLDVLGTQNADGSFPLTETLARYCGSSLAKMKRKSKKSKSKDKKEAESIWASLQFLISITSREGDSLDVWAAAARKTAGWLKEKGVKMKGEKIEDWVEKRIRGES